MRIFRKRVVVWLTVPGGMKILLTACLAALAVYLLTFEWPSARPAAWALPLSGKVIAIDPGHGGPDGGAVSKDGLVEKDVTLAIAFFLRDYLQEAGALVVMTRESDRDLANPETERLSRRKTEDLLKRAAIVKQENADLLVSIHLNSTPSPTWRGAQTFYSTANGDNANLAALIQEELRRNLQNTDRVSKVIDRPIYLLTELTMPSALVEVGFLSNPEEARLMAQSSYQLKVAAAIYQGILRYFAGETAETG